jgi:hypothetical protein
VFFPVDCVSHAAMSLIKRLCQQSGKPFLPLRSSGLTPFCGALCSGAALAASLPREKIDHPMDRRLSPLLAPLCILSMIGAARPGQPRLLVGAQRFQIRLPFEQTASKPVRIVVE